MTVLATPAGTAPGPLVPEEWAGSERTGRADRGRPPWALAVLACLVAVPFAGPVVYLAIEVGGTGADALDIVTAQSTLEPLGRTLLLATTVALAGAVVGTGLAWLTMRTDLPLRRLWAVLAPLPLVFPSFVGAAALLAAVAPGGLFDELLPGDASRLPQVEGFVGAFVVLTLFTYPYVYLPVAARLASLPPSLEESARLLGRSPWAVFRTVVWPQTATATWAGALLVFLYTVSDFGAVAQLRYRTLTVAIFESRLFARDRALTMGLLLAIVALGIVVVERMVARRRLHIELARAKAPLRVPLGRWRWPALLAVGALLLNALLGPLSVLTFWVWRGFATNGQLEASHLRDLAEPTVSSALLGVASAAITVALVLPVAYLTSRYRSRAGGAANAVVVGAFALPGLLVALALVFWTLETPVVDRFYQTLPMLLAAYALHFGAQAMRASQVSVASVPRRLDDAARVLGARRARRLLTVELPLMVPGLLAGAGLVLLSTMKELPATLLLRPTTLETLALEIWDSREAAQWAETGLSALVLVALSGVLTWFLVVRRVERFD
jgi:iron(III) transport system permease protein